MIYDSLSGAIYTLLFWWVIFFVWQRLVYRYPNNNWKRDIIVTFIQSLVVLMLLPVIAHFVR